MKRNFNVDWREEKVAGKRHIPNFEEFVRAHKVTECAGFWYCGPGVDWSWDARDYRVVLLAQTEDKRAWPKLMVKELVASSVRGLAKELRALGYEPPRGIGRLCESARVSPKPPQ